MFWDDLVRRWRRENPSLGPRLTAGAAGHVAVVPARHRRGRRTLLLLIVASGVLLALALGTGQVHAASSPLDGHAGVEGDVTGFAVTAASS